MSKKELKGFIQPGETEIAKYVRGEGDNRIFERQDGTQFTLSTFNKLDSAINCADDFNPILEITRKADSSYTIYELDAWPKEKENEQ